MFRCKTVEDTRNNWVQYKQLTEDEKRLYNRKIVKDRNKYLFDTARKLT